MSPEFTAVREEIFGIVDTMHYAQLGTLVVALAVLLLFKPKWLAWLVAFALPVVAAVFAYRLYNDWWLRIYAAEMTPEDNQWLADHDGGMIFPGLVMLFKAGMSWIFLLVVGLVARWITKRKKAQAQT
jgi:hypothetical protein